MFDIIELIILFITFIIKIVKWYIFTILPILIVISILCVLFGMCIRSGLKAGIGLIIIIITIIIFMFIVYGKDTIKIFEKIKDRILNVYFSGKKIFNNSDTQENNNTKTDTKEE